MHHDKKLDLVLNLAAISGSPSLSTDTLPHRRKKIRSHAFIARIKKLYRGLASGGNTLPGGNKFGSDGFSFSWLLVGGGNTHWRLDVWQAEHITSSSIPDFLHCAFENKLLGLYFKHAKHNITLLGVSTFGGKAAMRSRFFEAKASYFKIEQ